MADSIAIGLRALSFAAALQAAGIPLFLSLFDRYLYRSPRRVRALALKAAAAGLLLTIAHAAAEPARLAGELSGVLDPALQALWLASDAGTATAIRVLGLGLIAAGVLKPSALARVAALTGAVLVAASFTFMGHTATNDSRWLLAPLLTLHLLLAAFWLGALGPLLIALRSEDRPVLGSLIDAFSKLAFRLVPLIFVAGLGMAVVLLPGLSSLLTPYGALLLSKIALFAILMGLAALNKWRLGPGVGRGDSSALAALRRSVWTEWCLIVGVLAVTAAMTSLFSPEP